MTVEELKKGEYETVEYKQDIPKDKDKYLKTAVAFANAAGGRLIFGVENDTWEVVGFSDDEIFKKYDTITNSIFDACEPSVVPIMSIEEVDCKKVIVADIRPGMTKPYYLRKYGMMDGTFIRIAGVTRKAEPYMIKELQFEGTNRSFDSTQVVGEISLRGIKSLCKRLYKHALERCVTDEQRASQKKVTVNQLVSWKIIVRHNDKYYPTNSWKLLTGDLDELFPNAFIQMAAFKGTTRTVFLDKQVANGPIDQQIEDAMMFVKKHINLGSRIDGVYRSDIYELPIDSIREMISNAVCHRSYISPGSIQVAIYDDRLEVTSPGRLSSDLTIEQIINGNSRIQNPAIGAAFFYMHIIEQWGSGIPRIFDEARKYGLDTPELKDFGTSFRISISRKPFDTDQFGVIPPVSGNDAKDKSLASGSASNDAELMSSASNQASCDAELIEKIVMQVPTESRDRARIILEEMKNDPHITAERIGQKNGMSRPTVQRMIAKMKKSGFITHQGSNNGGVWVITADYVLRL